MLHRVSRAFQNIIKVPNCLDLDQYLIWIQSFCKAGALRLSLLRRLSSPQLTLIAPLCAYVIEHAADQEIFVGGGGGGGICLLYIFK